MKSLVIFGLILCLSSQAADAIRWSKGSVVEKDGQVKIGDISFQSIDLILFKADNQIMVYTPYHIKAFFYYDESINVNRKFNSLKLEGNQSPLFYEYVVWGKAQMMRLVKNRNLIKGKLRDTYDYEYLISWNNGYTRLKDFRHEVYPALLAESPVLEELVHDQKLNPSSIVDVVNILKLYNRVINLPEDIIARKH